MRSILSFYALAFSFFICIFANHPSHAEISANHAQGAVRIGPANDTCNAGIEGAIRYHSTNKNFEYCNATTWTQIASSACSLASMLDVQITSPQDGQPLSYNNATSKWVNSGCDTSPNSVNFTDLTQQTVSTQVSSNIIQINGIGCTVDISISGTASPEYRICSDNTCSAVTTNWTTAVTPINSGSYIQTRMTSSASGNTQFNAVITVGSVSDTWSVRTIGPKRVFVSSQTYQGDLGGLIGADSKCQVLADAVNLGSTFKAWLSDSTTSAASRFNQSALNYVMMNGTTIANGWSDLTDNTIDNVLNRDETNTVRSSMPVWTNTTTSGGVMATNSSYNCDNWTSNSSGVDGYYGVTNWADYEWTNSTYSSCSGARRLYCFEQ